MEENKITDIMQKLTNVYHFDDKELKLIEKNTQSKSLRYSLLSL